MVTVSGAGGLSGVLVVEVGHTPAGAYCGRLFGGHGAEVVAIGPPPDPAGWAPTMAFHDQVARRIAPDSAEAGEVLARADVVIRSSDDGPLPEAPLPDGPGGDPAGRIEIRLSPFAAEGPYRDWRSSDLVETALAGHLRLTGDPDREPLQGVADLGRHATGAVGFIGAMAALIARARTGEGQVVEVATHEVLAALHQFTLLRHTHAGAILQRHGNRYAGPGAVIAAYRCRDGWISLTLATEDMVERMLEVTGLVSMLERHQVTAADLMVDIELLNSELIPYLAEQDRAELVELWQALRLPIAPISTLDEVLADPHLEARGFWTTDASGSVRLPGAPVVLSHHPWSAVPSTGPSSPGAARPTGAEPLTALADGPLAGTRVLDLTRVWAGPLAARILADLGAEVVAVEHPWTRGGQEMPMSYVEASRFFPDDDPGPDPWNRNGFINKYLINKRSIVLDLNDPEARDLFARLVPAADVVIENYSPRVMPAFGFDEAALHALNPDLVYVTMPGYGRSGPHTDWVAYGPTIDGHVGHTALMGYRGEGPWKCGVAWPDPIGGLHAAAATLVALLDRLVDPAGGGQTIEVAQVESAINVIGPHLAAAQLAGAPERPGNRRAGFAPQGVYRCAGDDRWLALSVRDDRAWTATCRVLGLDDLAGLDSTARTERHDELDDRIAAACATRDDVELAGRLQAEGAAAGFVADAADVLADPQLAATGFLVELEHPSAGTHRWPRLPARLSATPATIRSPAPLMGADNEYVAVTLGGLPPEGYRDLVDRGVVRTDPPE